MSFGQTWAPEWLHPFFNSAMPVVALAAAVAMAARGPWTHVVLGAAAGPLALIGYYATATMRGYAASSSWVLLWSVAGILFGATMGIAVWLLRGHGNRWWRALAAAVFPAVALGEAAHGLLRIADSTPAGYWWVQAGAGVATLAWAVVRFVRAPGPAAATVAATAAGAGLVFLAYGSV